MVSEGSTSDDYSPVVQGFDKYLKLAIALPTEDSWLLLGNYTALNTSKRVSMRHLHSG